MRSADLLIRVGRSAARALRSQDEWIHRRVESLTFPLPDQPVYRRHVSIDFTVPPGLMPAVMGAQPGPRSRYYVPLSLIRKWPPLPTLDLRDANGSPMPFLTARQNRLLDAAALGELALETAPNKADVPQAFLRQVAQIALTRGKPSQNALSAVLPSLSDHPNGALPPWHEALRADRVFRGLATALHHSTLLWFRVEAAWEDREIVKVSYAIPYVNDLGFWAPATFGWESFIFEFDTPHVGSSGSYHLNLAAPSPLEVVAADLVLYEPPASDPQPDDLEGLDRHEAASYAAQPQAANIELFAGVSQRQAKFYVSGDRAELSGRVYVAVLVEQQGLLRGAVGAAAISALVLLGVVVFLGAALRQAEATVAMLLIAPAVLGYLLVRPSEHVLAGGLLAGVRRLVVSIGCWPVFAAVATALSGADERRFSGTFSSR